MGHLCQNGMPDVDFFKEKAYTDLWATQMKRLKLLGIGATKWQAEFLTEDKKEVLWREDILGYHSPKSLLNTVFFSSMEYAVLLEAVKSTTNLGCTIILKCNWLKNRTKSKLGIQRGFL